ncbi:MAG TPA: SgcJ/EcaC family oxidoreductase [Blastocatellia bacterium]|nr:SgcJ/EcaC family oxidoreductase [Blastocatellia bacterium]
MSSKPIPAYDPQRLAETEVRALYRQMINSWNRRCANAIGELFAEEGSVIQCDGLELKGRDEIVSGHKQIFEDHHTGAFVGKVRSVTFLDTEAAVLRAAAGMVMPGETDFDKGLNAIQTLTAVRNDGRWQVVLFQNTPALFRDRPDEAAALADELRRQL